MYTYMWVISPSIGPIEGCDLPVEVEKGTR